MTRLHRTYCLSAIVLCISLNALSAFAATATVVWTNPTTYTDGSPLLAGEITASTVYRGTKADGSDLSMYKTLGPASSYIDTITPGTWCYAITVTAKGAESDKSNVACKTALQPKPNAPTGLTLSVTGPTAYKMRQTVDGFSFVSIGTVPLGTACQDKNVDGYSVIPRDAVKLTSKFDTKPLVVFAVCS